MEIKLNMVNDKLPRVARIMGTHSKYGLARKWVWKTSVLGTPTYIFYLWDDGVYELVEGGRKEYIVAVAGMRWDVDGVVPDRVGDYMRDHRCDRDSAYELIWDELQAVLWNYECYAKSPGIKLGQATTAKEAALGDVDDL